MKQDIKELMCLLLWPQPTASLKHTRVTLKSIEFKMYPALCWILDNDFQLQFNLKNRRALMSDDFRPRRQATFITSHQGSNFPMWWQASYEELHIWSFSSRFGTITNREWNIWKSAMVAFIMYLLNQLHDQSVYSLQKWQLPIYGEKENFRLLRLQP